MTKRTRISTADSPYTVRPDDRALLVDATDGPVAISLPEHEPESAAQLLAAGLGGTLQGLGCGLIVALPLLAVICSIVWLLR